MTRTWLKESFGDVLLTSNGEVNTDEVLSKKSKIAIYFSAEWCPPCKAFTPILSKFYQCLHKDDEDDFEVIFASSDNSDDEFGDYFGTHPWTALPYNSPKITELSRKYGVQGIPALIVLHGDDGRVIDATAREMVSKYQGDPRRASRKWSE